MYNGSMQAKIESTKVARQVTDLAGCGEEFPFVTLNAASDAQRNFAGDVRLHAVAQIWQEIDNQYQSPEMAKAIIAAVNLHMEARWWLDNKNKTFIDLLGNEIEAKYTGE